MKVVRAALECDMYQVAIIHASPLLLKSNLAKWGVRRAIVQGQNHRPGQEAFNCHDTDVKSAKSAVVPP
jgi:hypothetical protein